MKGLGDMMKQAQEMQQKVKEMQDEALRMESIGQSGAGMVKVTMNGRHDVLRVEIDPAVMSEDKSLLEDLLAAAVNDAVRKVEEYNREKMSSLTGGIDIPGFKMPF